MATHVIAMIIECLPFLSSPKCEGTKFSKLQLALTFIRAWLRAD